MKKEISPLTMVISVLIVVILIVGIYFLVGRHNSGGANAGNGSRTEGMQALQKLNAQGAGSASSTTSQGMNAMKNLAPGGYGGAKTVGQH